ncbi:MAG: PQQ-binding-like beta-propeller repeat protein, partial [Planctomycetota bacterium]|nr:PQQ-binding-like beta-propeller repeat protein [Planctomycetota bacterium]
MRKLKQLSAKHNRHLAGLAVSCAILLAATVQGQEWTRFRGPNGQGISHAKTIPIKWTENDYNWKVSLPGGGHSSPVVWRDKVFVTACDQSANRGFLLALNVLDGKILWQKEYALTPYRMNSLNSYATATPAVDANCIYALWPTADQTTLVALSHDGAEVWKRTFGGVHCQHGAGSSPIVLDDIVVFTYEHENSEKEPQSAWIAVDC